MTRLFLLAAAALLPAGLSSAAAAETVHDTHEGNGAIAGRSPHRALRQVAAVGPACGRPAMHSIPAGKGHVYGRHALPGEPCATARSAAVEPARARGE